MRTCSAIRAEVQQGLTADHWVHRLCLPRPRALFDRGQVGRLLPFRPRRGQPPFQLRRPPLRPRAGASCCHRVCAQACARGAQNATCLPLPPRHPPGPSTAAVLESGPTWTKPTEAVPERWSKGGMPGPRTGGLPWSCRHHPCPLSPLPRPALHPPSEQLEPLWYQTANLHGTLLWILWPLASACF